MAISRWRAPRESEREATRHKLEVAGSMPGLTSGCALFLQRVALVLIERERDHAHAGADGDLRASLFV